MNEPLRPIGMAPEMVRASAEDVGEVTYIATDLTLPQLVRGAVLCKRRALRWLGVDLVFLVLLTFCKAVAEPHGLLHDAISLTGWCMCFACAIQAHCWTRFRSLHRQLVNQLPPPVGP